MFTFDLPFGVFPVSCFAATSVRLHESGIAMLTFRLFHRTRERPAIVVHDSIVCFRYRRQTSVVLVEGWPYAQVSFPATIHKTLGRKNCCRFHSIRHVLLLPQNDWAEISIFSPSLSEFIKPNKSYTRTYACIYSYVYFDS